MKLWSCSKVMKTFKRATAEHHPSAELFHVQGPVQLLRLHVQTASPAPKVWQESTSWPMWRMRHTKLRSIFPKMFNKDQCHFMSKMSPPFWTLITQICHFLAMCVFSVFYFSILKVLTLLTPLYPRRLTSCNNLYLLPSTPNSQPIRSRVSFISRVFWKASCSILILFGWQNLYNLLDKPSLEIPVHSLSTWR